MQSHLMNALSQNKLALSESQRTQLLHYLDLILRWNKVFNLTNITDPHEMTYLHLIDSLLMQPFLHGTNLLDVGTGAGLPGIPLAITNPEQHWTLLDKNSKKTRFLTQVVAELKLDNIEIVHSRSEDFQPGARFDSILSRAFGSLDMFVETTEHLLAPNGRFIAMKGKYPGNELLSLPKNMVVSDVHKVDINGMTVERHVVIIQRNSCG